MKEQEWRRHNAEFVARGNLQCVEAVWGQRLGDEVTLTGSNVSFGHALAGVVSRVTVKAKDDLVLVGVIPSIAVDVMDSEGFNATMTAQGAAVVDLPVDSIIELHVIIRSN